MKELPSHHTILTDYHIPDRNSTLEIDLVVINGQGVFLLEVKDWSGRIEGDSTHCRKGWANPRSNLPEEARDILRRLLNARPGERLDSILAVKTWLELFAESA